MLVEAKLKELGLILPKSLLPPTGVKIPFAWARAFDNRVYISGHVPQNPDGSIATPLGKVGAAVSPEQAANAARLAALSMLASLQRTIGDLDRVVAWLMVSGMVNVAPGFIHTTNVITSCSELLLELFGPEIGQHARTAIGMAQLPFDVPVIIAAEVAVKSAD